MALPSLRGENIFSNRCMCVIHDSPILANRFHARDILQNVQIIAGVFLFGVVVGLF